MRWITERWKVLTAALGQRRYILDSAIGGALVLLHWIAEKYGLSFLGQVPTWAVACLVVLALVAYWLLELALKLDIDRRPRISVSLLPVEYVTNSSRRWVVAILATNESAQAINGCLAKIEDCRATLDMDLSRLPLVLQTSNQAAIGTQSGRFHLNPRESKRIVVATRKLSAARTDKPIELRLEGGHRRSANSNQWVKVKVAIYGGGDPTKQWLRIKKIDEGLRCDAIDEVQAAGPD